MIELTSIIILLLILGFSALAFAALVWAFRDGQFHNINDQAKVIFNDDEPEGKMTDFFPIRQPKKKHNSATLKS